MADNINNEPLSNDRTLGSWLKDLVDSEIFQAQVELENRILASHRSKLESLSLNSTTLQTDYVHVRAMIDAIKALQSARARLIENRNNRNPA